MMQEIYRNPEIRYLTAEVTELLSAPRYVSHYAETEGERFYYPYDPEDPRITLLDDEGESEYQDVNVLACPFCRRVFRYSEITELSEETREDLEPVYGDSWREVALLHDIPYGFIGSCPACGHAWNITPANLHKTGAGSFLRCVRMEVQAPEIRIEVENVFPHLLTAESVTLEPQTMYLNLHTDTGESVETAQADTMWITFREPWRHLSDAFSHPEVMQAVISAIEDMTGFQAPELHTLQELCLWNRLRMGTEQIAAVKELHYPNQFFGTIRPQDTAAEKIRALLDVTGVHDCKTSRRALIEDLRNLEDLRMFSLYGFTSMDALRAVLADHELCILKEYNSGTSLIATLTKPLIKVKGEMNALRCILGCDPYLLRDTAHYYECGLEQLGEERCRTLLRGSVQDIHDRLLRHVRIADRPNEEIPYTTADHYRFDHTHGGIRFALAADTDELFEVGGRMSNCVATYCDSALEGRCLIVVGREETGTPVLCIEVSAFNRLAQVKANRNTIPEGRLAQAAYDWVQRAMVDPSSCTDYAEMVKQP